MVFIDVFGAPSLIRESIVFRMGGRMIPDVIKRGIIMKRVGIYLRVSTDTQTTENQRRELEAVAARSGWEIVGVYEDAGISGAKGRGQRPAFVWPTKGASARQ